MTTTEAANKGKTAEKKVADYLKAWDSRHQDSDQHRVLDARAAGGRFNRQCGDFVFYRPDVHGVIEVKETQFPERLPHGNFGVDQVAKLRKRQLAGGVIVILVYHTQTKVWRLVPLEKFFVREKGSWYFNEPTFSTHTVALDSLGVFG